MNKLWFFIACVMLFSCKQNKSNRQEQAPTPFQNQESTSSSIIKSSKRGKDNMVFALYNELLSKDSILAKIDLELNQILDSQQDSTFTYISYDQNNEMYYADASVLLRNIKDSILMDKLKSVIESHKLSYENSQVQHKDLIKTIDQNRHNLTDLYTVIKVVKTLPIIEKFQKEHHPSLSPLQKYQQQQNNIKKQMDSLVQRSYPQLVH